MSDHDLKAQLRKAAIEIAQEGHSGWGNLCIDAANALERLSPERAQDAAHGVIDGIREFVARERALRDAVGKGGQSCGRSPSISPSVLNELERILATEPTSNHPLSFSDPQKARALLLQAWQAGFVRAFCEPGQRISKLGTKHAGWQSEDVDRLLAQEVPSR